MSKNIHFTGQPIFSQLLSLIPSNIISESVKETNSDRYYKTFKSYDHLVTMLFACFQKCTSLREVTTGMMACYHKLEHLGVKTVPRRSTLSEANSNRSVEFFSSLYNKLYKVHYKNLPDSRSDDQLESKLYLIDSTTIKLFSEVLKGMGSYPVNGKKKGGVKAHVVINAQEDVPCYTLITSAQRNDKVIFGELNLPKGAIAVFDRGYNSYKQFEKWNNQGVNWVTRLYPRSSVKTISSNSLSEQEENTGVISDSLVELGSGTNVSTPIISARLVKYHDKETGKTFDFITNNNELKASVIADIYKRRWQIELLFKRLKQNYPLKYFLGDNENAIKIQIWCSLITDLLLKIVQKNLARKWSFTNLASMVRLHLMTYLKLINFLEDPEKALKGYKPIINQVQLDLFDP